MEMEINKTKIEMKMEMEKKIEIEMEMEKNKKKMEKNKKSLWKCKTCKKYFSSKRAFQKHVNLGMCLGKAYLCKRCLKICPTQSYLKKHQAAKHKCKKRNKTQIIKKTSKEKLTQTFD